VYLDFDERTNRILMIGRADQLDVVEELIDALDVAQQDLRTLRVYEIQYIDAEEVRKKLGELGIIGGVETTPRRSGRRERPTRKPTPEGKAPPKSQPPPTASTAGVEQPLVEEPQVIIIESINSLLVNATAEQHAQIAIIFIRWRTRTPKTSPPSSISSFRKPPPNRKKTLKSLHMSRR
jgi:type II secretory pathway component GspD/PulD (secretin)